MSINRSADAGILGFTYQFMQTAIKLLEIENQNTYITVEGIEDLDIVNVDSTELIQYKYHESTKFSNSAICKPISLMFKHFLDNKDTNRMNFKYTLFCYFSSPPDISELNNDRLKEILSLQGKNNKVKDQDFDNEDINLFSNKLKFLISSSIEQEEKKLIEKLHEIFQTSKIECSTMHFSNCIDYINKLATKKNSNDRVTNKKDFIDYLKTCETLYNSSFLARLYGTEMYIKKIQSIIKDKRISAQKHSLVFHFSDFPIDNTYNLIELINTLKFVNRNDYKPITFIMDLKEENLVQIKKEICNFINMEDLNYNFNDGLEHFNFVPKLFNDPPLLKLSNNPNYVVKSSYHFKIISKDTYLKNIDKINISHPIHFFIGDIDYSSYKNFSSLRKIIASNLNSENFHNILGG